MTQEQRSDTSLPYYESEKDGCFLAWDCVIFRPLGT